MIPLDLTRPRSRSWLAIGLLVLVMVVAFADRSMTALAIGTLASEDLTCITAGQLVRFGKLDASRAVLGCLAGIYVGDLGLWFVGRAVGRPRWIRRYVRDANFDRLGQWFERNAAGAILGSRFLPGARLPMYLAAGAAGGNFRIFATWTFVAALLWTPLVVLLVASLGIAFAQPFENVFGSGWIVFLIAVIAAFALLRVPRLLSPFVNRYRLIAAISRIWRWEFWPMGLFYLPLAPWIAWLAIRHRSLTVITAANPGIPHGGIVGESKYDILRSIHSPHVLATRLVRSITEISPAELPLVLKPEVGQRGAGVRFCHTVAEAAEYFRTHATPVLVQPADPGPYEAGIFYYRVPGETRGRIFSVTDKKFPILVGDGVHTIEQLIWRHPRFRMQAATFLRRHAAITTKILASGEHFQLASAGNHCQGTMFRDGSHLLTPQLEAAIDEIAQTFEGFYYGRFDVRYKDTEAFKAGRDLAIVELNGVTSESTNLYDPAWSLLRAYRTLFRQWSILFRIGAANQERGARVSTVREIVAEIAHFYRGPRPEALSD